LFVGERERKKIDKRFGSKPWFVEIRVLKKYARKNMFGIGDTCQL
jgi:hypothetical protein